MTSNQPDLRQQTGDSRKLELRLWIIVGVSIFATLLVIGGYAHKFGGPLSAQHELWGQFGDYVGGLLNPIFGFLALIGLLLTIALQSRELRNSTIELQNSSRALHLQNESIREQTFESAFFSLIRFQNDIVKDIDIRGDTADASGLTVGRDCFKVFYRRLKKRFQTYDAEDPLHQIDQAYLIFFEVNQADIGHYFRHLYHIIKFVDGLSYQKPSLLHEHRSRPTLKL